MLVGVKKVKRKKWRRIPETRYKHEIQGGLVSVGNTGICIFLKVTEVAKLKTC